MGTTGNYVSMIFNGKRRIPDSMPLALAEVIGRKATEEVLKAIRPFEGDT